jgi:cation:H+ antiporter
MVVGGPVVQLGIVAAAVLGLWLGSRLFVDAAVRLAEGVGLSELTIGLTVVAVGTSLPEVSVTVDAALRDAGDIAVANVLGSNVYNLAFILGVLALLHAVPVGAALVRRDGVALLAATALGGAVLLDLRVTRAEGALLVGAFVAYTAYLLWQGRGDATETGAGGAESGAGTEATAPTWLDRVSFPGRNVVVLAAGLALVLVSGDALVVAASALARAAGVSEWVIGGTIVAAGTSTPEFAVSLMAVQQRRLGVSVGNIVGSNVFNSTAAVGVAAVVQPLAVTGAALTTLAWLAVVTVVMVAALWTNRVLSRSEGALFTASELVRWTLSAL